MRFRILSLVVVLLLYTSLLKAQFFQGTLTVDNGDLVVSLIPICGDVSDIKITQIGFSIESTTPSSFTYGTPIVNTTNFPGAPIPAGGSSVSSGTQTTTFTSSFAGGSVPTITYTEGTPYELVRIPISDGIGTGDFDLIASGDFSSYFFNVQTTDGGGTADATYSLCLGGSGNTQLSCPGTCTADNHFTGDDVESTPDYREGVSNVPLPVELISFNVYQEETEAVLKWSSAQELNFKGYEVERSVNGKDFVNIGWLDGAVNTLERQQYIYRDKTITGKQAYYYRLRMVDLDNSYEYSSIVVLNSKDSEGEYFQLSPNPVNDLIGFDISLLDDESVRLEVRQISGQLVYKENQYLNVGENRVELDGSYLSSGIYLIAVYTQQNIFTERFVKK